MYLAYSWRKIPEKFHHNHTLTDSYGNTVAMILLLADYPKESLKWKHSP